ncbi:phosphoesterase [Geomonas silvestris]|uniref:Phosphoesterase n=1 Tax=Geomonas silvestris TaxID=2740184 RepID=A0A6V8MLK3_9BACT|nr:metallophosphoesterase family protein [Geomonas silvestris]GFO60737.1 phosphoesterase [Geomonas silvestris]
MLIGVISDTHGLLRPEALRILRGADHIIHAGDIGTPEVIYGLRALAPVTAVRGNVDRGAWVEDFPQRRLLTLDGVALLVLHDRHELLAEPADSEVRVIVTGHSHRALVEEREGVLYLNPGSAGPRRFRLPVTVALLTVNEGKLGVEIVDLGPLR